MISQLFFIGKVSKLNDTLIYDEDFVIFYLKINLLKNGHLNFYEMKKILLDFYSRKAIKENGILKFCTKQFKYNSREDWFELEDNESDIKLLSETLDFLRDIENTDFIDKENIYSEIEEYINKEEMPYIEKFKKLFYLYYWQPDMDKKTKTIIAYHYYIINKNFFKIYRLIDNKVSKISNIYDQVEILDLDIDEYQRKLLLDKNIYTLKSLKRMSIRSLICIFCKSIEKFLKELTQYTYAIKDIVLKIEEEYDEIVKPEKQIILTERYSIKSKRKTLAEIGEELELSRERVRQIEAKSIRKICDMQEHYKKTIYYLYKTLCNYNNEFIIIDELEKYIENEKVVMFLVLLMEYGNIGIRYNNDYKIIFDEEQNTLENLIQKQRDEMEKILSVDDVKLLNKIQTRILEKEYRLYQNRIWVNKTIRISDIYLNELKNNFINGYNIGDEEDYNRLIEEIKNKYGDIDISSQRSIVGMIDRGDFIQIDKGTYLAKEYAAKLSDTAAEELVDYVIQNGPIVLYSTIYAKFKNELNELNINNKYYLKGLLDEVLPKEFNTNRDYINTNSESNITALDIRREIFKSFPGEFSLEDLQKKMPGLEEYSYLAYIRIEEKNGLIKLGLKNYIYIEKLNIYEDTIKQLKEYIEKIFEQLDSKVITSMKIYASMKILNKELLSKLNIKPQYGEFALFSIIQYLFEEYYYSRPFIAKEKMEITTYTLIKDYALSLDIVNNNKIRDYIQKMNMGGLYSYLNFIEELSDKYVQVSVDEIIKKEKLFISEEKLERIDFFLEQVLQRESIYTDNFDGYSMLPKLNRNWNQYLLVGIIRTYFKDKYVVENTTNFYDTTSFIIRRIEDGRKE